MLGSAETEGQTTEGCRGKGESSSRCPGYCRVAQCRSNPNVSTVVSDVKYIASDSSKKGATNISKSILQCATTKQLKKTTRIRDRRHKVTNRGCKSVSFCLISHHEELDTAFHSEDKDLEQAQNARNPKWAWSR